MADNTRLNAAEAPLGDLLAQAEISFSGDDDAKVQVVSAGLLTGSEGSWTHSLLVGGTGVDAAGVQRVSLATDVPLPAGTNAIGKLAANDGVDIGDVTINGMESVVDGTNSTTDILAEDAVFTGTATDTLMYGHVTVGVFADQVSATDGLSIEWSSNGTNWDSDDKFTIPASKGKDFTFGPPRRYVRVVYTNGAVAQGAFRLQTILRVTAQSASSHRIADSISGQDDAELVKAVLTGLAPDTSFKNVLVTNAGEMKVSLENINGVIVPVSQSGTWNITNVSGTVSLPTGASTSALQTTGNTSLGQINNDTTAIASSVDSIDGKITACNTGAVVIASGTVTTVSTVTNLSQLGGQAIAMGTGVRSAGTQRVTIATDDVVPVSGSVTIASGTITTITNNVTVVGTGTFVVQENGAALTALQLIDDTVAVLGTTTYTETSTKGNVIGAVRNDDLATLANTDNEIAPLQVDAEGAVYVNPAAAEPKRASGVAVGGTPGTDDIVAAVGARKIRCLALTLIATSTTTNSIYLDNVDNDLLFNTANPLAMSLDADGDTVAGLVMPYNPGGWFETDTVNEAVTLNSSAAEDIAWTITYIEVP